MRCCVAAKKSLAPANAVSFMRPSIRYCPASITNYLHALSPGSGSPAVFRPVFSLRNTLILNSNLSLDNDNRPSH
jgi:hypothetical protein